MVLKVKLYKSVARPTLLYNSKCWDGGQKIRTELYYIKIIIYYKKFPPQ